MRNLVLRNIFVSIAMAVRIEKVIIKVGNIIPSSFKLKFCTDYFALCTTSRIKTVRAGERDCPQDNPLSKQAQNFDSRQALALFLYSVTTRFFNSPLLSQPRNRLFFQ